ncbi:MAG: NADH-quinone oxidoreductase subunit I [Opitutae bacterium]|jgi:NADH-quinone oxidoreductase subunit A|nr:NADH-quinone oxidoreductase subunit I [Opitutae bacterium]|tara:strand:- start:572 stop:946 length:375 start_codon:yes stop_codon:yes gene_type:complete
MSLSEYLPVFIQIALAIGLGVGLIIVSRLFGAKGKSVGVKDKPYECGMLVETSDKTRYAVKFYLTAMLFILFDVDIVFLVPWVLAHREFVAEGIPILGPMLVFVGVMAAGLLYELKKGALEWDK